jgi:DNA-binding response OmpR family regulator
MARILVVNDTQEILEAFQMLLEDEGFEVVLSSYAILHIDEILRIQPDLIILDYIFGGEKLGWQMLQLLRMNRTTEKIPIVVCTAATREVHDIEGYMLAENIALVPKPFNIDTLVHVVQQALATSPQTAQQFTPPDDDKGQKKKADKADDE